MVGFEIVFFCKRFIFIALFIFILGARYFCALPVFDSKYAGSYIGQKLIIEGEITMPPIQRDFYTEIYVHTENFRKFGNKYPVYGLILVHDLPVERFFYGDHVVLEGFLQKNSNSDPRIAAFINKPDIKAVKKGGNVFLSALFGIKHAAIKRLSSVFPEPFSGFLAGILFGSKSDISASLVEDFRRTGLTHIIALSGFNIIILISFISAVFSFLPRRAGIFLSIATVFAFVCMVGASASVVRAGIMGSLALFAKMFGRSASGLRPLLISGFLMALADPFIIFYDIGFQLSFAATAGIIVFSKRLSLILQKIPNWIKVRECLATTISAQIFTLPIILFYFKGLSTVMLISNLLVLPFIPLIMLGGFLSLFFGKLVAAPTLLLCEIIIFIIHFLSGVPFAFIDFGTS